MIYNKYIKMKVSLMMTKQIKSKERVADHGEVFTNEKEVKAMCDLVKQETERIDSRFLEPACGDGNFLIEILKRKLEIVKKKYKKSHYDYERYSLLALGSVYGVELLEDNVVTCRNRLFEYWKYEYKKICKKDSNEATENSAKYILSRNIIQGNALTLMCVDDNGNDTKNPIVFSEWTLPFNDARMQRNDYTLDELLNEKNIEKEQLNLLETDKNKKDEGKFLKQYISHYKRINEEE